MIQAPEDIAHARERYCEMLLDGIDFETAWDWRVDFLRRRRIYICKTCGPQFADKFYFYFLGTRSESAACLKCKTEYARRKWVAHRARNEARSLRG